MNTLDEISGTFYRADGEYSVNGLTALNVLEYEAYELGNDDALNALLTIITDTELDLKNFPATALLWVCAEKKNALRYARDEDGNDVTDMSLVDEYVTAYNVRDALVIIPDDGDGGMLILTKPN